MDYSTNVTYLYLEGHVELEKYRYMYFLLTLSIYILIICSNAVVVSVIYTNKHLHEPMYIFVAALLCNGLLGATGLYPKLLHLSSLCYQLWRMTDMCQYVNHYNTQLL